jgi:PAS domain S-box-containing protein
MEGMSVIRLVKEMVHIANRPLGFVESLKAMLDVLYRRLDIERAFIYLPSSPNGADVYIRIGGDSRSPVDGTCELRERLEASSGRPAIGTDRCMDEVLLRTLSSMAGAPEGMPLIDFPIESSHGQGVVGLLAVFIYNTGLLSQDDVDALEVVAGVISLKLDRWFCSRSSEKSRYAIAAAKQEWERTVDMLPELILLVDHNGQVIRSNRTLEAWFSRDIKDVRGVDCHELMHSGCEQGDCVLGMAFDEGRKALRTTRVWTKELWDPLTERHFRIHIRRLYDESPPPDHDSDVHATIVIQDISSEKAVDELREQYNGMLREKVEEATALLNRTNENLKRQIQAHIRDKRSLRESEARYATLSSITQTGIYVVIERKIVFCNERFAAIFGRTVDELVGMPIDDVVNVSNLLDTTGGGASRGIMCGPTLVRARDRAGREIWLSQSAAPIIYKGRAALLGNVIDNTDLIRVQHSLEESKHRLESLYREYLDVQEKERQRIAYDLHDGIGQTLSGIKLALENVIEDVERKMDGQPHQQLRKILKNLQVGIDEVRRTAMNLRPATLDHFGIIATIEWFCREFDKEARNIHLDKEIEVEEHQIPEEIKVSIFRIIQEAFNNIVKHARARNISLHLYEMDQNLVLLICDDGVGMEINRPKGFVGGLGLLSMRERAEFSQGRFQIDSAPERGTRIKVQWPLASAARLPDPPECA